MALKGLVTETIGYKNIKRGRERNGMRLQDIMSMTRGYLELGIALLVVTLVVLVVGYWGIYKKLCKGKREFVFKQIFWWIILIFYLFVVLSVTLFRRSGFWNGEIISFFYSHKDAWISASAWRNIILNILMFVPMGFWLPVGKRRFRVFWKTYLLGFALTIGIEFLQLTLSLGMFEVADIFNNTLGTMIGYGCYKVVEYFVLLCKKEKQSKGYLICFLVKCHLSWRSACFQPFLRPIKTKNLVICQSNAFRHMRKEPFR